MLDRYGVATLPHATPRLQPPVPTLHLLFKQTPLQSCMATPALILLCPANTPCPVLPLAPSRPQVNYNLLAVNAFMAVTGIYQLSRKIRHDMEKKEPEAAAAATTA